MRHHTIGRIISTVMFGFVLGLVLHHEHVSRGQMGREGFLTWESARFDLYFSHPAPLIFECFTGLFFISGLFVAYEAAAYGIARILTILADNKDGPAPVA
jgi:hypothetical protein